MYKLVKWNLMKNIPLSLRSSSLKTYCSLFSVICSLVNDVSSICVVVLFFFNRSAGNVIAGNLLSALVPEIIYYYVLLTV